MIELCKGCGEMAVRDPKQMPHAALRSDEPGRIPGGWIIDYRCGTCAAQWRYVHHAVLLTAGFTLMD